MQEKINPQRKKVNDNSRFINTKIMSQFERSKTVA